MVTDSPCLLLFHPTKILLILLSPVIRELSVIVLWILPPCAGLVPGSKKLKGGALIPLEPHCLHHDLLGLKQSVPVLAAAHCLVLSLTQSVLEQDLPVLGVLPVDSPTVVHQKGALRDGFGVVSLPDEVDRLEGGQELVVHVLGREGDQAEVPSQRLELQVHENHGGLVRDWPLPRGGIG